MVLFSIRADCILGKRRQSFRAVGRSMFLMRQPCCNNRWRCLIPFFLIMCVGSGSLSVVVVLFFSSFWFVESIQHPVDSMCFYDLVIVIGSSLLNLHLHIEKIFMCYFYINV